MSQSLRERLEAARQRMRQSSQDQAPACNYLFLSDVHLGEYIKEHSRIEYLKRGREVDRDLCDFLDYYASHTVDDRPWRLVIVGDFLDFLTVTVMPSERARKHQPALELDEEEEVYGLDNDEEKTLWKLERIADRHQMVFTYLADFVGRGHYLDMLYGNHDVEFFWPLAKQGFVKLLTDVFFGTEQVPGQSEREFIGRIRWHEWFYLEPGKFYAEHGNQYDDFSSFRYRLHPVAPFSPANLAMPASHLVIRYFVNRLEGFRSHNKDDWTMWDFMAWTFRQGWSRSRFILSTFTDLMRHILAYGKTTRSTPAGEIEAMHLERLEKEAGRYELDPQTVRRIDSLTSPPIHESRGHIVQGTSLDQMWMIVAFALLLVVALLLPGWQVKLTAVGVWLSLVLLRKRLLRFIRNHFLDGEITTVTAPKVDAAAVLIAEQLDVRYVVLGHTHRPQMVQVRQEPPCWYVNIGSWLPPRYKERHVGGCRSSLTYGAILDRAVPEARLYRWCQRNNRPEPFLAHLQAEADVPEHTEIRTPSQEFEAVEELVAARGRRRDRRPSGRESLRKRRY